MTTPIPHAATVLLLREGNGGLEVLLTKRAAGLSFMGGLWVFPGGRMEPSDQSSELASRADTAAIADTGGRMLTLGGEPVDLATARGLLMAACRETFEESGVLLARPRQDLAARHDDGRVSRVTARRAECSVDAAAFVRLLVDEDLVLDVEHLVYWAHWITPAWEKKRFDTRFFALPVPDGQVASVDFGELTHHAWLKQDDVRRQLASGEMRMAPPTLITLQDLWSSHEKHGRLDRMLAAERTRTVPPILPKRLKVDEDRIELVLPWDEHYLHTPGDGCIVLARYPEYIAASPSRISFPRPR